MKNYIKPVLGGKNIEIFVFEDTDEIATERAVSRAREISAHMNGVSTVVWAPRGFVPKHFAVVGQAPDRAMS